MSHKLLDYNTTVDGAELQLTSWGNGGLSHYLRGFIHPNGGWPWDFRTINSMNIIPSPISWPTWSHWRLLANSSASRQLAPPQACGKGGGPRLGILKLQGENVGGTSPNFWHSKFYTPEKPRWNLKTTQLNRKSIFQTSFFGFHVHFPGWIFFQCTTHSCFEKHRLGFPFSWRRKRKSRNSKIEATGNISGLLLQHQMTHYIKTYRKPQDFRVDKIPPPPPPKKRCYQDCTTHGFAALPPNSFGKPKLSGLKVISTVGGSWDFT